MPKKPYCRPHNAGLCSETPAVCRRISRLFDALSTEINDHIVEGRMADDIRAFRFKLIDGLQAEGWTMSYDGGNKLKVRPPGHRKPFPKFG